MKTFATENKQSSDANTSPVKSAGKAISLPAVPAFFNNQQPIQKKPALVDGITHLVEKKGNSILKGEERDQLNHSDEVDVNTGVRIRSRRGPNQEAVSDYDQRGKHIYRWFLVNKLGEEDIAGENLYIREDTFDFVEPDDKPLYSKNLDNKRDKRTRQSHVAVKFEVWYNEHYFDKKHELKDLDRSGHLVMKDYSLEENSYKAYEQDLKKAPRENVSEVIKEGIKHDKDGIAVPGQKAGYTNLSTKSENPDEIKNRLKEQHKIFVEDKGWIKAKKGDENQHKRFTKKQWVELLITQKEYKYINELFEERKNEGGFYCFLLEARTELGYELATRCLSFLEDIVLIRKEKPAPGHAKEVLDSFAELFKIHHLHQGEEDI